MTDKLQAELRRARNDAAKYRTAAREARDEVERLTAENRNHKLRDAVSEAVAKLGMTPTLTFGFMRAEGMLDDLEPEDPYFADEVSRRVASALKQEPALKLKTSSTSPRSGAW